jgi:hypothetical protein
MSIAVSEKTISLVALFEESTDTAKAIDDLHTLGIPDDMMVVMTDVPYPERALGRSREWSTLPYIVLAGAVVGLLIGLFLSVITPHLYRLDVGGHPPVGFPPAAVITFVFTMMGIIVSTFLGVLWEMDFPRFGPAPYHKAVTDGKLGILVEFPPDLNDKVNKILKANQADYVGEPEMISL